MLVLASLLILKRTSDLTLPAWEKTSVRAASSVLRGILAKKICRPRAGSEFARALGASGAGHTQTL